MAGSGSNGSGAVLAFPVNAWKYNSPNVRYLLHTLETYIEPRYS